MRSQYKAEVQEAPFDITSTVDDLSDEHDSEPWRLLCELIANEKGVSVADVEKARTKAEEEAALAASTAGSGVVDEDRSKLLLQLRFVAHSIHSFFTPDERSKGNGGLAANISRELYGELAERTAYMSKTFYNNERDQMSQRERRFVMLRDLQVCCGRARM